MSCEIVYRTIVMQGVPRYPSFLELVLDFPFLLPSYKKVIHHRMTASKFKKNGIVEYVVF